MGSKYSDQDVEVFVEMLGYTVRDRNRIEVELKDARREADELRAELEAARLESAKYRGMLMKRDLDAE